MSDDSEHAPGHAAQQPVRADGPLAAAVTPDGEALTLNVEHGAHVVRVRGELLMSSRLHGSEAAMAEQACAAAGGPIGGRVLVAGLGMGFTLRALLDRATPEAVVEVLELLPEVVAWNRDFLGAHAAHPLDDPRVALFVTDLLAHLATDARHYDAILVDVDNGPEAFTVAANARLYQAAGLAALHQALVPGGVLVVWSAFRSPRFLRALAAHGFAARSVTARARSGVTRGARHTLFVATRAHARRRPAAPSAAPA